MNRLFYPAVFHVAEEGGFWITFPDLPECMTRTFQKNFVQYLILKN